MEYASLVYPQWADNEFGSKGTSFWGMVIEGYGRYLEKKYSGGKKELETQIGRTFVLALEAVAFTGYRNSKLVSDIINWMREEKDSFPVQIAEKLEEKLHKLTSLEILAIRGRARALGEKLCIEGLTPEEIKEFNRLDRGIRDFEQNLGRKTKPTQVGEFSEPLTGKIVSVTYEGEGRVGLRYLDEDSSNTRIRTVEDLEEMKKLKWLIPTNPMRSGRLVRSKGRAGVRRKEEGFR